MERAPGLWKSVMKKVAGGFTDSKFTKGPKVRLELYPQCEDDRL